MGWFPRPAWGTPGARGFPGTGQGHWGRMTLLTDGRPTPPLSADPAREEAGLGFHDCRGVWHRLDDDGSQD